MDGQRLGPDLVTRVALLLVLLCFGGSALAQGLDLPLAPPRLGGVPTATIAPLADEDDGDDPRDTPPPTFYGEEIDAETDSIIYVLDISGSMFYPSSMQPKPIDSARRELARSIAGLSDNFRFNVLAYNCRIYQWQQACVEASSENKSAATAWFTRYNPMGGTGTAIAVAMALSDRSNYTVVLLTDGAPNCGVNVSATEGMPIGSLMVLYAEQHRRIIRETNTQGATIHVFGIMARGSWRAFCQGVASDSGGRYVDVN